jgi:hypothetical protein
VEEVGVIRHRGLDPAENDLGKKSIGDQRPYTVRRWMCKCL